jgi:hypothetical protein
MDMVLRFIAALFLILMPGQGLALDFVTATPGTAYVQGTGTATVAIRWTVQVTVPTDQTVTITSSGGTLVAGAAPPVVTGTTLRRTVRLTAGTHQVRITERLRIDRTSARYILEGGGGLFTRIFTDTLPGTGTASVVLQGRASGSGGLTVQNLDLSFDDGSSFRSVASGEALAARVSLSTSGRGLIQGAWQIAGPEGGFRTLQRVRLTAGGPKQALIESPPLPTDRAGSFRLRFVLGEGEGAEDPVIRYTVGSGRGEAAITLTSPPEGAALGGQTRFRWEAVAGAERYRIEFLAEADLTPLASVETAKTGATVRPFTLERLASGDPLVWRVVALGASGEVIARSAQRRIGGP